MLVLVYSILTILETLYVGFGFVCKSNIFELWGVNWLRGYSITEILGLTENCCFLGDFGDIGLKFVLNMVKK